MEERRDGGVRWDVGTLKLTQTALPFRDACLVSVLNGGRK